MIWSQRDLGHDDHPALPGWKETPASVREGPSVRPRTEKMQPPSKQPRANRLPDRARVWERAWQMGPAQSLDGGDRCAKSFGLAKLRVARS